jgi:hypothetical protein
LQDVPAPNTYRQSEATHAFSSPVEDLIFDAAEMTRGPDTVAINA